MVWVIHARPAHRHDGHVTQIKARWTALGSIDDVSVDCGQGVHEVSEGTSVRREMSAFSKPIVGVFRWDVTVEQPEVFLTWSDQGEPCEERIPLGGTAQRHVLGNLRRAFQVRGT